MSLFRKKYSISGHDNKLLLGTKPIKRRIKNLKIAINGNHNSVHIDSGTVFGHRCRIYVYGDNNDVHIGRTHTNGSFYIYIAGNNCKCRWGRDTTAIDAKIIIGEDDSGVIIGDDCMLSNVDIRSSDGHSIFDVETGDLLNRATKHVCIGNHCWIGTNSVLTKNACLPDNTVVGAMSLVSREFTEQNTIIAGVPARVIKRGVNFARPCPSKYKRAQ